MYRPTLAIGLCGQRGSGKDTAAYFLSQHYGFVRRAYADPLYEEVAAAFQIERERLAARKTKEIPQDWLAPGRCLDRAFADLLEKMGFKKNQPMAPRQILQFWGTEYRRAQQSDYWLQKMEDWLSRVRPIRLVVTDIRFPDEAKHFRSLSDKRQIWLVERPNSPFRESKVGRHHKSEQLDPLKPYLDARLENPEGMDHFRQIVCDRFERLLDKWRQEAHKKKPPAKAGGNRVRLHCC